ncbi:MAG TPA: GIY-YIG nuclease family protein [Verrucomicrobiae bacterium]|nr:GIY-YIG nuclease family protein [Verrucomicrobiae bacterium]
MEKQFFVYILRCRDGSYYTGYTLHLEQRLKCHNAGKASKYTRARLPVAMVYWEAAASKGEALSREAEIKRLTRRQKDELVKN